MRRDKGGYCSHNYPSEEPGGALVVDLSGREGAAITRKAHSPMRYALLFLLLLSHPGLAASTRGTIEASVVTVATMTRDGKVDGPRPDQKVVVKNPDGSVTIRADY